MARFSPSGYYLALDDFSSMVRAWDAASPEITAKGELGILSGLIDDIAWGGESKRSIAVGNGKERYACSSFY